MFFFKSIIDGFNNIGNNYFNIEAWKDWYLKFVIDVPPKYTGGSGNKNSKGSKKSGGDAESVALEVLYYRKKLEYFGGK